MIFVDASALLAVIMGEADAAVLARRMQSASRRLCSAMSIWQTVSGLCRSYAIPAPAARAQVRRFLNVGQFEFVDIAERESEIALDAYARFGKGRHPAALNMGDCFAYACAKSNQAKLLYKGNDFTRTDLA